MQPRRNKCTLGQGERTFWAKAEIIVSKEVYICFIHLPVTCDFPRVKGCSAEAEVAIAAYFLLALMGI